MAQQQKPPFHVLLLRLVILGALLGGLYLVFRSTQHHLQDSIRVQRDKKRQTLELRGSPSCPAVPFSNSEGLVTDAALVCNLLHGWEDQLPTIHFENIPPGTDQIGNYIFVNADYTHWNHLKADKTPKFILCKTHDTFLRAQQFFLEGSSSSSASPHQVLYTGFTSLDHYDPTIVKRYDQFLHVAGKSGRKGTRNLVLAWMKHPEWPQLIVVARGDALQIVNKALKEGNSTGPTTPKNITILSGFIPDKALKDLVNVSGFHVCPSLTEGFGHYANEARGVGAVVLYSDGPALQEFFRGPNSGIPIQCQVSTLPPTLFSGTFPIPASYCAVEDIEDAVQRALQLSVPQLHEMGKQSREAFMQDRRRFVENLHLLAKTIGRSAESFQ